MPNVRRTPLRTSQDSGRRPLRPIDREKMRSWLVRILDARSVPGVRWVDKTHEKFEIPWRHAARQGWSIEKDACIFELWAKHTRKYIEGKDKHKDPKRWKANFRCALNSLPDVERVTGTSSKGSAAVRQYRFTSPDGKTKQTKAPRRHRSRRSREEEVEEEEVQTVEQRTETHIIYERRPADDIIPSPVEGSIPMFDQLLSDTDSVSTKSVSSNHMSGCSIILHSPAPSTMTPPTSPLSSPPTSPDRPFTPDSVNSLSDSELSCYSEEEPMENLQTILESELDEWSTYHPCLWAVNLDVASHVEIGGEEEVTSVINLEPQPEYWDLSSNSLSSDDE